jgi:eukaryotic-like serine/threonine-protein kinase
MSSSVLPGARLGRYEIKSQLGAGGMGEVYLAHDTELDRTVAIKILPVGSASDQQRLQRFIQEAKAASALNHPHILTVYEIGTTDLSRFIATEFIEGDTLRQRIKVGLKLIDILEISIQAASALAAAHAAGIIHRDIKPDNSMVRRDGYIKLLDFGLAKLAESKSSTTDTEAPTMAMVNTDAGTVMGTANYMSPEQAKGTDVDARTDLWSLGAVLYEMLTGHVPFAGETPTETISLILQREPAPPAHYIDEIPAELERILTKTLTKDREDRYQTAKDLLIDLRNLKRKLEVDAEIDRTVSPELRGASTKSTSEARSSGSATAPTTATPTASSAEYIFSGIRRHKIAAAVVILALIVGAVGLSFYLGGRGNEAAIDSIAVLPFENQNHDPNTDYLSDGVTESIINSLTQLPTLRVIARSSAFRYKGKETDPMAAGKELGVRAVLTGRVTQRGDSLTISTELLDVRDNKQLWGEQYNAKISDLLSMQRAIASQITSNLRLKLSGAEQSRVNKHYTENPDAYQLYLKGRFYWNKRTGEGFKKSIEYFNQAIERDPNYALAYAGLADSYNLIPYYSVGSPQDFYPKAKAAAKRALELDDTLAEAHTSLGYALFDYDWNFPEASREFQRAIELNPNYASAHQWYGRRRMMLTGRFDEAITEVKRALELDPLSLAISTDLGNTYIYARQYDRAIEQLRKTIDMDQNFYYAHWWLGTAYVMKGDFQNAIAEYQKARQLNDDPYVLGLLGHSYAVSGKRDEALKTLRQLKEIAKQRYVPAYSFSARLCRTRREG